MSQFLTSAEAAEALGVGATAIKRWADTGALPCVRTAGGHRRFSRAAVETFLRQRRSDPQQSEWDEWIEALDHGSDVYGLMARLFDERGTRGAWYRVATAVGELLRDIGARWERGDLTIVQEHIGSACLQRAIAAVVEGMPVRANAPRCLLATAEGDDHTLGLSLAELCLREAGWRAEWVGNRTRTTDIIERVKSFPSQMVALSASAAMSDGATLRSQARMIGAACRRAGIPLVLGGDGAWPAPSARVVRVRSWNAFHRCLVQLPAGR